MNFMHHLSEGFKHIMDALAAGAVVFALAQVIPLIGGLLGIVWYGMQIYDRAEARKLKKQGKE